MRHATEDEVNDAALGLLEDLDVLRHMSRCPACRSDLLRAFADLEAISAALRARFEASETPTGN